MTYSTKEGHRASSCEREGNSNGGTSSVGAK
jgi:hypothetical protein